MKNFFEENVNDSPRPGAGRLLQRLQTAARFPFARVGETGAVRILLSAAHRPRGSH